MLKRRGLGKGLDSLIPVVQPATPQEESPEVSKRSSSPLDVSINSISPNRQQPRQVFDEERIKELANSIREQGIIQPLIVSETRPQKYELIAGERRLRAARMLGLEEVPVIVKKDVDEGGILAMALIENVQREDLNPIEEAKALQDLIEHYEHTQEEVAKKVGKSRTHVTNSMRLLKLPQAIQDDLACGRYTAGHARALLSLPNIHEQLKMRDVIIKQIPSVRDVEELVQRRLPAVVSADKKKKTQMLPPQVAALVGELTQALGTKVRLKVRKNGSGQVIIDFYSAKDLDRVYRIITRS
jgi:ParB family chromosome partitioning protein